MREGQVAVNKWYVVQSTDENDQMNGGLMNFTHTESGLLG